jgi:hypothetical protein
MQARLPLGPTYHPGLDTERLAGIDGTILRALAGEAGWVNRRHLLALTNGAAVNSSIARLRKRGHEIEARRTPGAEHSGSWEYRLTNPHPR